MRLAGGHLALQGVDVILNPSASHFAFGKDDIRQRFVTEGSRAFGVVYLYANLMGNEAGRIGDTVRAVRTIPQVVDLNSDLQDKGRQAELVIDTTRRRPEAIAERLAAWVALRRPETPGPPSFRQLTFRRGQIFSARFSPDDWLA